MITVRQLLDDKGQAIHAVQPGATVLEAVRAMAEHEVGALLVMEGGALRGIVSERDYARKVILHGRASADTLVSEIMSAPVYTVTPGTSVQSCMQLMTERRVRHLPVSDGQRVIGVVSIGDIVKALMAEQRQHIEQLEHYIYG